MPFATAISVRQTSSARDNRAVSGNHVITTGTGGGTCQAVFDRKLQERVQRSLGTTSYRMLSGLQIQVMDGHVRLLGHVPSYYMKQLAQTAVMKVEGIGRLHNDLRVSPR
ncbi:MAG: BON domain-containing protein [Rhodopirellula sp.]|nr:BON domain-containing protein [Rhodopirellula sp.]